jgi:septal ring-binding cell division protein DamX
MDLLFRLVEFLVHAALDENKRKATPAPRSQPSAQIAVPRSQSGMQRPAQPSQAGSQPLVPRTQVVAQDPAYDDGGWRSVLTVLAIIALLLIVALWIVYVTGRG